MRWRGFSRLSASRNQSRNLQCPDAQPIMDYSEKLFRLPAESRTCRRSSWNNKRLGQLRKPKQRSFVHATKSARRREVARTVADGRPTCDHRTSAWTQDARTGYGTLKWRSHAKHLWVLPPRLNAMQPEHPYCIAQGWATTLTEARFPFQSGGRHELLLLRALRAWKVAMPYHNMGKGANAIH